MCCLNPFLRVLLGFRKSPLYPESCSEALLSVQVVARVTAEMRVRGRVMIRLTLPRASHSGDACARTRARRLTHPTFGVRRPVG